MLRFAILAPRHPLVLDMFVSNLDSLADTRGNVAVIVPVEGYRKSAGPEEGLGDFLMASSLRNSGMKIERDQGSQLRELSL